MGTSQWMPLGEDLCGHLEVLQSKGDSLALHRCIEAVAAKRWEIYARIQVNRWASKWVAEGEAHGERTPVQERSSLA